MIYLVLIALAVFFSFWLLRVERRINICRKASLELADSIKEQTQLIKALNTQRQAQDNKIAAIVLAVNAHASDLSNIIKAVNSLSNDLNGTQILQPDQKDTIH